LSKVTQCQTKMAASMLMRLKFLPITVKVLELLGEAFYQILIR